MVSSKRLKRKIAPLPTDADFVDFASNHYKSPIGLAINRADRLTNHL